MLLTKSWRVMCFTAFILIPCISLASNIFTDENRQLIRELDELLDHSDDIYSRHEQKIKNLKNNLAAANNNEEKYWISKNIFDQYKKFDGDSAMKYGRLSMEYASQLQRPDLNNDIHITSSYILAAIGLLDQSEEELKKVNTGQLSTDAKIDYLGQQLFLLTHLDQFQRPISPERAAASSMAQAALDSVVKIVSPSHPDYHYYIGYQALTTKANAKKALDKIIPELSLGQLDTPNIAKLAWVISQLYLITDNPERHFHYLLLSAITDMNIANREIASLEELATIMENHGDLQHANKYIEHCMECAELYKNRVRALRVATLQKTIYKEYQEKYIAMQKKAQRYMILMAVMMAILIVAIIYIYKQRRELSISNKELHTSNKEVKENLHQLKEAYAQLAANNDRLLSMSEELKLVNDRLAESNYVKVKCIGSIFALCSQYLHKMDNMRKNINRQLKTKLYDKALAMTENGDLVHSELKEFYENFDSIFLSVYPDFVQDFNDLLNPDDAIIPKNPNTLNTELRIYALVRLGITDSVTIAEVLHCSVQTVYNKRMKTRNKSIVPKEDFVEIVKNLGKSSRNSMTEKTPSDPVNQVEKFT